MEPVNDLWTVVELRTTKEAVEAATAKMRDLGAQGVAVEEADPLGPDFVPKFGEIYEPEGTAGKPGMGNKDVASESPGAPRWAEVATAAMGPGEAVVTGYWPGEPHRWQHISTLLKNWLDLLPTWGLDPGKGDIAVRTVREADWADAWKQYYRPVTVRGRARVLTVCPAWETYMPELGEVVVRIDPGMAFGTGTHETTRLCLGWLLDEVTPGCRVLDVGCGSGILSVSAAALGAGRVLAVDLDPLAVEAARHNVEVAGVADRVEVRRGDLLDGIEERGDLIVANLLADLVERLLPDVHRCLTPKGRFLASGILVEQEDRVARAMEAAGLAVREIRREGAWCALSGELFR
ncbi:Ribosomal protein L11 methyltransferase [Kyrpidia spormannii]|uniref:Ribosomal protein L11 methyltransferase n=1 Tax=Kyrpidia spormannii TaxID=2055160 RepID=A0ACA8ZAU9_9BACL|nr:Ribosomal protein L11 methyltransferase [Kyrpidia spormannii]